MKRRRDWVWNLLLILAMLPVAMCVRWNVAVLQRSWVAQEQWIREVQRFQKQSNGDFVARRAAWVGFGAYVVSSHHLEEKSLRDFQEKLLAAIVNLDAANRDEKSFFASHPMTKLESQPRIIYRLSLGMASMIPLAIVISGRAWVARRYRRKVAGNLCVHCGYCLTGNLSGICPECGEAVTGANQIANRSVPLRAAEGETQRSAL